MTEGDGSRDEMGPFLLAEGARYVLVGGREGGWVMTSVELVGTTVASELLQHSTKWFGSATLGARYGVLMEKSIVEWNFPMRTSPRLSSSTSGLTPVEPVVRGNRTSTGTNPLWQDWPWVSQGDVIDRPAYRAHGSAALSACRKATCVL